MQSVNSERAARAVWALCVVVPLVCVAMCGTISVFILAGIFLIVTAAQALRTAPFRRTPTPEAVSCSALRARGSFKHLLVVFSVCTFLLLALGSGFGGGINLLRHGSFYVNTKNSQ
jgi:hypothetical protein